MYFVFLCLYKNEINITNTNNNKKKKAFKNLSIRSCKISLSSWISIACSFKEDRSKIRIIN